MTSEVGEYVKNHESAVADEWNTMLSRAREELNPEHWVGQFVGRFEYGMRVAECGLKKAT